MIRQSLHEACAANIAIFQIDTMDVFLSHKSLEYGNFSHTLVLNMIICHARV